MNNQDVPATTGPRRVPLRSGDWAEISRPDNTKHKQWLIIRANGTREWYPMIGTVLTAID